MRLSRAFLTILALAFEGIGHAPSAAQDRNGRQPTCQLHLHTNTPSTEAQPLLTALRDLESELEWRLDLPPGREPIVVHLFRDRRAYVDYLHQHFPQVPYRQALFIKQAPPGQVLAHLGPDCQRDLRHEFVHALLHSRLKQIPLWLDEGLATYFELPPENRPWQSPYFASARIAATHGSLRPLHELESITDFAKFDFSEYRDCWAWTHFLLDCQDGPRAAFLQYLAVLAQEPGPAPLGRMAPPPLNSLAMHLLSLEYR